MLLYQEPAEPSWLLQTQLHVTMRNTSGPSHKENFLWFLTCVYIIPMPHEGFSTFPIYFLK